MENTFTDAQNSFMQGEGYLDAALRNLKSASFEKFDNKIRLNSLNAKTFVLIEIDYNSPSFNTNISLMSEFQNGTKPINRMSGIVEYSFSVPVSELDKIDVAEIVNEFLLYGTVPEERSKDLSKRLFLRPSSS